MGTPPGVGAPAATPIPSATHGAEEVHERAKAMDALQPMNLPMDDVLRRWIPERLCDAERPIPRKVLGWVRMVSHLQAREKGNDIGNVCAAPNVQCFTDTATSSVLILHEPAKGPRVVGGARPLSKLVLWPSRESQVDMQALVTEILKQFAASNTLMFTPLDKRHTKFADASGFSMWYWGHGYNLWRPTEASYCVAVSLPADAVVEAARDEDIEDIMSLSTVPYNRQYFEKLVHAEPFCSLNAVVRCRRTGRAMSWALTHEDFSIALVGTKEEHRGQGLACAAIKEVLGKQRGLGNDQPFAFIATDNGSSQRLFQRAQFVCEKDTEFFWCTADKPDKADGLVHQS